jgi:hypothetical protein
MDERENVRLRNGLAPTLHDGIDADGHVRRDSVGVDVGERDHHAFEG